MGTAYGLLPPPEQHHGSAPRKTQVCVCVSELMRDKFKKFGTLLRVDFLTSAVLGLGDRVSFVPLSILPLFFLFFKTGYNFKKWSTVAQGYSPAS